MRTSPLPSYPLINAFGEIDWSFQPKKVLGELKARKLAVYDWHAGAYVSWPITVERVHQLADFARRHELVISSAAPLELSLDRSQELVDYFFARRIMLSQTEDCPEPLDMALNKPLPFFHQAAVLYAVHTHRCFIADPETADRRITALAAVHQVVGYPCVLICRRANQIDWLALIAEWLPADICTLNITEVNSATPQRSIWLVDYHTLERGNPLPFTAPYYRSVIVDHAHFIKNPQAARTQQAAALAARVNYRFLVTDFPVNLSPADFREPLEILGKQAEFADLGDFLANSGPDPLDNRALEPYGSRYQRKLAALFYKLRATCLVRRADDPGLCIQQHIERIELSALPERIDPTTVASNLRWFGLAKVAQAITWLHRFLDHRPGKVLIFAHHQDVVEEIMMELELPAIYGKVPDAGQRSALVQRLLDPDGPPALIVAEDVELCWDLRQVAAVVFVELMITPRELHRIVDHILGPEIADSLPVYLLISDHPLDWRALKRLELRLDDYDQVLDGLEPE